MNIQPNMTTMSNNNAFKGTITVKNFKTGETSKFITSKKTDEKIFTYFHKTMRDIYTNFSAETHVDLLSEITKKNIGKNLEFPKASEFMGEMASKILNKDGKKIGQNYIEADKFFRVEHKAPYIDVNSY